MKFTLFSRLVLGYLLIFVLMLAVGLYAVYQLRRSQEITRTVLERDRRILDLSEKLGEALLSEVRYERKFLITKDKALYGQFQLFQKDFDRLLDQAAPLADSRGKILLEGIRSDHQRYRELFGEEIGLIAARKPYSDVR
ncbi:MAG TPA: hypothetical protein VGA73_16535, partial [Candidatus Binatia bacterium]